MKPLNQIERKKAFWKFLGINSLVMAFIAVVFGTGFMYVPQKANKQVLEQFDIQFYMADEMLALDTILKKMNDEKEDGKWNDLLFSATKLLDKWKSDDKLKNSSLAQSIVTATEDRRTDKQMIRSLVAEIDAVKQNTNDDGDEKADDMETEINDLKTEVKDREDEIRDLETEIKNLERGGDSQKDFKNELQNKLRDLSTKVETKANNIYQVNQKIKGLRDKNEKKELVRIEKDLKSLAREIRSAGS